MLVRKISTTIKDKQAVFFMTISNNIAIGISNFNSRSSVLKRKVNVVFMID